MKKIGFVIATFLLLLNCSVDEGSSEPTFVPQTMPINDVFIPESFVYGDTYNIMVDYYVPNTCYSYRSFYVVEEENIITAAVFNSVINDALCEPYNNRLAQASFDLKINSRETYVLKFWRGKNNLGEDNYYIVEVPVTE